MTTSSKPWGIVLEWDEDGLTCCTWVRTTNGFDGQRYEFENAENAQWCIDNMLHVGTRDVIATPRQFT